MLSLKAFEPLRACRDRGRRSPEADEDGPRPRLRHAPPLPDAPARWKGPLPCPSPLRGRGSTLPPEAGSAQEWTAQKAAKQAIWKELQQVLEEGEAEMRYLREGVRAHYGKRNEKLVEFGVQPFRGIKRKSAKNSTAPDVSPASAPDSAK